MKFIYSSNCVCLMSNVILISNCMAGNIFESPFIEENQGFSYNSVHKRSLHNNETDMQSLTPPSFKKWQVGRVSRKHYEIINMLWRKTKVFMDVEAVTKAQHFQSNNNTKKFKQQEIYTKHAEVPFKYQSISIKNGEKTKVSSSTPSFIEFYYFDETDDSAVNVKNPTVGATNKISSENKVIKFSNVYNSEPLKPQSPRIELHANEPNYKQTANQLNNIAKNQNEQRYQYSFPFQSLMQSRNASKFENALISFNSASILGNKTYFEEKVPSVNMYLNRTYEYMLTTSGLSKEKSNIEFTTAYDRVKFFEIYDSHTVLHPTQSENDNFDKLVTAKDILNNEKNDLINVNQNIGHSNSGNKSRHKKKHITSMPITITEPTITTAKKYVPVDNVSKESLSSAKPNITYEFRDKSALEELIKQTRYSRIANVSRLASWSYYPFVAVYVYEPTQTHCDAAGISPHWLIAAGACLSRHHTVHSVDARSAFVTYCGESWREPERIAYVKYSIVHPKFNPRDRAAKYNFNIGLIQVSSSMASSCSGWAPISLMSHQYAAGPEGSLVSALGWGLDRYGTKYMTKDLPHLPLTVYEGLVYSDSCPGSHIYSKAKRRRDAESASNVFCLLLPPYSGEAADPVHGGLLLEGGKLIALYLQEERRPSGLQSAQYTGVWRLIPWVLDVAREPEDLDSFPMDL